MSSNCNLTQFPGWFYRQKSTFYIEDGTPKRWPLILPWSNSRNQSSLPKKLVQFACSNPSPSWVWDSFAGKVGRGRMEWLWAGEDWPLSKQRPDDFTVSNCPSSLTGNASEFTVPFTKRGACCALTRRLRRPFAMATAGVHSCTNGMILFIRYVCFLNDPT